MKCSATTLLVLATTGEVFGSSKNWVEDETATETATRTIQTCPCNGEEQHVVTPVARSDNVRFFDRPGMHFGPFGLHFGPPFPPVPGKTIAEESPIVVIYSSRGTATTKTGVVIEYGPPRGNAGADSTETVWTGPLPSKGLPWSSAIRTKTITVYGPATKAPNNNPWLDWSEPPLTAKSTSSTRTSSLLQNSGSFSSSTSSSSTTSTTNTGNGVGPIGGSTSSTSSMSSSTATLTSSTSFSTTTFSAGSSSSSLSPIGGSTTSTPSSTLISTSTSSKLASSSSATGSSSSYASTFSTSFTTGSTSTSSSSTLSTTTTSSSDGDFGPVGGTSTTSSSSSTSSTTTSSTLNPESSTTSTSDLSSTTESATTSSVSSTTTSTTSSITSSSTTFVASSAVTTDDVSALSAIDAILEAHNVHRANHTANNLTWSDNLASIAAQTAASCVYQHDTTTGGGGYGQNIGAGYTANRVPSMIGNSMYNDEMQNYPQPYGQDNPDMSNFDGWGHFSQIVWKGTTEVGCTTQYCPNGLANAGTDISPYFTVCNYSPPGNIQGAYSQVGAPLNKTVVIISPT